MRSVNADRILPPHLLEEVRKYFPFGGLIYMPVGERRWNSKKANDERRNETIRRRRRAGWLLRELAAKHFLSVNRISEICHEA